MPKLDGSPTKAEADAYDASLSQHPALDGKPKVEIADRSADEERPTATNHLKVYVVLKRDYDQSADNEEARDAFHLANIEAERQALISTGLRPTGDGSFLKDEPNGDGYSVNVTYSIPVVPAVTATDPEVAHAHVTLDDQHTHEDEIALDEAKRADDADEAGTE